jgi:PTS system nitrogen regulatory IIA component
VFLTELLTPDRIRVPILAQDKSGVLRELVRFLVQVSGGREEEILSAVEERESVLSTGIGFGIAIPHAKSASVESLALVCGRTAQPIPFDSLDGEPVRLVFLLVGPESAAGQHVKALSRIARLVRRESVRQALLAAETPEEFHRVITEAEGH